ncbi:MAG: bifunctional riboflavin kinase/FAD synthetase [Streptosporangiales bacterium]
MGVVADAGLPVWQAPEQVPDGYGPSVVTIGVFDGVHRGHQFVVGRAVELAREKRARAVVVTFHPHPQSVVRPDSALPLLSLPRHRVPLLGALGADAVLVLPFTRALSSKSPEEFVELLAGRLHPVAMVVGADFRFGHKAAGDVATLTELGSRYGFGVEAVAPQGEDDQRFSSSRARQALLDGDVDVAATVLGRAFAVSGPVVEGAHRGRELGFPTANLDCPPGLVVPADGVYAGWLVRADGARLPAAVSVGDNPMFSDESQRVEAHCLDRDDLELYGERVRVEFVRRLRGQLRLDSLDALVEQMKTDVDQAREVLA